VKAAPIAVPIPVPTTFVNLDVSPLSQVGLPTTLDATASKLPIVDPIIAQVIQHVRAHVLQIKLAAALPWSATVSKIMSALHKHAPQMNV
jgi:hypothetical protein